MGLLSILLVIIACGMVWSSSRIQRRKLRAARLGYLRPKPHVPQGFQQILVPNSLAKGILAMIRGKAAHEYLNELNGHDAHFLHQAVCAAFDHGIITTAQRKTLLQVNRDANVAKHTSLCKQKKVTLVLDELVKRDNTDKAGGGTIDLVHVHGFCHGSASCELSLDCAVGGEDTEDVTSVVASSAVGGSGGNPSDSSDEAKERISGCGSNFSASCGTAIEAEEALHSAVLAFGEEAKQEHDAVISSFLGLLSHGAFGDRAFQKVHIEDVNEDSLLIGSVVHDDNFLPEDRRTLFNDNTVDNKQETYSKVTFCSAGQGQKSHLEPLQDVHDEGESCSGDSSVVTGALHDFSPLAEDSASLHDFHYYGEGCGVRHEAPSQSWADVCSSCDESEDSDLGAADGDDSLLDHLETETGVPTYSARWEMLEGIWSKVAGDESGGTHVGLIVHDGGASCLTHGSTGQGENACEVLDEEPVLLSSLSSASPGASLALAAVEKYSLHDEDLEHQTPTVATDNDVHEHGDTLHGENLHEDQDMETAEHVSEVHGEGFILGMISPYRDGLFFECVSSDTFSSLVQLTLQHAYSIAYCRAASSSQDRLCSDVGIATDWSLPAHGRFEILGTPIADAQVVPKQIERRVAWDFQYYSYSEYIEWYGEAGEEYWQDADPSFRLLMLANLCRHMDEQAEMSLELRRHNEEQQQEFADWQSGFMERYISEADQMQLRNDNLQVLNGKLAAQVKQLRE